MEKFPAVAYDKWKNEAPPFEEDDEHEAWCDSYIDSEMNDCNCPVGAGHYREEDDERWHEGV